MSASLLVAFLIWLFLSDFKTENKLNVLILLTFRLHQIKIYVIASLPTLQMLPISICMLSRNSLKQQRQPAVTVALDNYATVNISFNTPFSVHIFCFCLCLCNIFPPNIQHLSFCAICINFHGWLAAFLPACVCEGLDPKWGHTHTPLEVYLFTQIYLLHTICWK